MVKRSPDIDNLFDYSELWPYFSGGQPERRDFYMWLFTHDIVLSDPACLELDSLGFHIKKLDGEIYVANKTDTIVVLSSDPLGRDFVVANGSDTLVLSLKDSLPIEIPANHSLTLRYESKENSSFFKICRVKTHGCLCINY